jgi:hypothetical protein
LYNKNGLLSPKLTSFTTTQAASIFSNGYRTMQVLFFVEAARPAAAITVLAIQGFLEKRQGRLMEAGLKQDLKKTNKRWGYLASFGVDEASLTC